ncbi:MAG: type I polyketide synthase [Pirellulaceae bacterium]
MSSTSERMAKLSPQKLALLKKAMGDSDRVAEPIAIVGMGCRFAGAASIADYWRLISEGVDATGEIPLSRWDVDAFFDATPGQPGKMHTRWGGFIDNIDRFDASFFGISPREAEKMDPQHRLLLQVVWEALEYGGIAPTQLRESATGVFVGVGGVDYSRIPVQLDNYFEQITAYSGTGNALSIAANRISYTLDLRGPSLAIDTACSSSLVAVHLAVRSLRSKECDTAIVGGVNAILTPETTLAFSQAQMLSPEGQCRPFDDHANGYVRGEGCGVVILKRLSDAVSDGDMILGTIRGTAINQDGTTSGITAPRGTSQVEVIRRALHDAKCGPDEISYVEAHGTATPLGDPIELGALAEVFQRQNSSASTPCYVGSVKANIGHTETAAGMASLIKTILMFRHQTIPGQVHFQKLNHHVDLTQSRLQIATDSIRWETSAAPPKAGISSFGFGGTNAHLVVEAGKIESSGPSDVAERPRHVMAISAKSASQLQALATRLSDSISDSSAYPLADACFTAAVGRATFRHRLAVSAASASDLKRALKAFAAGESSKSVKHNVTRGERRRKVAFLFPGQGTQARGMGRRLFETQPVFRKALETCDEILSGLLPQRLLKVLYDDASDESLIHQPQYTQTALFAVEYAMSRLWRSFGIEPAVMLGHSIGDYVAACEANVFSLEEGLTLVADRGRLVQNLPAGGSMAVVFAERDRVADLILPYEQEVAIAAHNGPKNVVISGRTEVVNELLSQFASIGVECRELEISSAMHSPLLEPILDEFEQCAAKISFRSPTIPLISSRDGRRIDDRIGKPEYWRDHLRHTVCFADAAQTLQTFGIDAAIEVGSGTTLCGLASRIWSDDPIAWLPSLRTGRDDWDVVCESVSELFVRGVNIDWKAFDQPWSRRRLVLPTYPFEPQSFWYDMSRRQSRHVSPMSKIASGNPLVGTQLPMAGDKTVYEVVLETAHPAFLSDHRVDQSAVVPATAYIEQALAIAEDVFGRGNHLLENLSIEQPMVLPEGQRRIVQTHVGPDLRGERTFEVYSRPEASEKSSGGSWTMHASGTLKKQADSVPQGRPFDRENIERRTTAAVDGESFYQKMVECGLQYGPMFQLVQSLHVGENESLCRLEVPTLLQKDLARYRMHPAVMDACLQSIAGVVIDPTIDAVPDLMLPTNAQRVCVLRPVPEGPLWVHTQRSNPSSSTDSVEATITLYDNDGHVIAELDGARVQRVSKQRAAGPSKDEDLLYALQWRTEDAKSDVAASAATTRHQWLLFADSTGIADALAADLCSGDAVCLVRPSDRFTMQDTDEAGRSKHCKSSASTHFNRTTTNDF